MIITKTTRLGIGLISLIFFTYFIIETYDIIILTNSGIFIEATLEKKKFNLLQMEYSVYFYENGNKIRRRINVPLQLNFVNTRNLNIGRTYILRKLIILDYIGNYYLTNILGISFSLIGIYAAFFIKRKG